MRIGRQSSLFWNVLFVLALLAILFTGWYGFLRSDRKPLTVNVRDQIAKAHRDAEAVAKKAHHDQHRLHVLTWRMSAEELGSTTLDWLTGLAEGNHLVISGFKTDRPRDLDPLKEVPFGLVVEGTFPNTMNFLAALEEPRSKLMVSVLQLSSADPQTDRVTATIGLSGFIRPEGL
ncbi:MAG TPA: hypothetical protein VGL56_08065 [Fimbriimonadaceae bacterium]|jgi:hypothetical protein